LSAAGYKQITFEQRQIIEKLIKKGETYTHIADLIDVDPTSLIRETRRCPSHQYDAFVAQENADMMQQVRKSNQMATLKRRKVAMRKDRAVAKACERNEHIHQFFEEVENYAKNWEDAVYSETTDAFLEMVSAFARETKSLNFHVHKYIKEIEEIENKE